MLSFKGRRVTDLNFVRFSMCNDEENWKEYSKNDYA